MSRRKPLPPEDLLTLRSLVKRHAGRAALTIAADWSVVILVAVVCERLNSAVVYLVTILIIARQMNALSELHHHAMHNNLFHSRVLNTRLQAFYSLPLFTTVQGDLTDHLDHHRHYAPEDSLIWGVGYGLDLDRRASRSYMFYFLWIRPFIGPLQIAALLEAVSPKRLLSRHGWPIALFWGLVVLGFLAIGNPGLLLRYWFVPCFTIYPIFFFWEDMLGHYNCPRTGTRDFRGLWFRLLSPHGTAFHNIHHLYPLVPWFNMGRATAVLLGDDEIEVARGFIDGMRQLSRFGGSPPHRSLGDA